MAITINGTGSITGLTAGGLPDGSVTSADLASGAITSGALPTGSILQVVQTVNTGVETTSSSTYADIPGMSVNITPSTTNSKILVFVDVGVSSTGYNVQLKLYRGSTEIYFGDAASGKDSVLLGGYAGDSGSGEHYHGPWSNGKVFLDSPSSNTQVTYKLQWRNRGANTTWLNRSHIDNTDYGNRSGSSITVMEVAG